MLSHALKYAERGWQVFPCRDKSKKPATRHGFKDATTDADTIRRWWSGSPNKNLAIVTGAVSGLVVIDIDPRHGGDETLSDWMAEHGDLPPTPKVATGGGGFHLYFKHPADCTVPCRPNVFGSGVDIKADGGYVLAPPSVHPSGEPYRWEVARNRVPLVEMPRSLLDVFQKKKVNEVERDHCWASCDSCDSVKSVALVLCTSVSQDEAIEAAIARTLPHRSGQRNKAVFRFARYLKSIPSLQDSMAVDLFPLVKRWHLAAEPAMSGDSTIDDTLGDFAYAWNHVKFAAGQGPIAEAMVEAEGEESPSSVIECDDLTQRLAKLCRALQRRFAEEAFFLDQRTAADLLGTDQSTIGRRLQLLRALDVLELKAKGHTGRASEYFWKGD